MALTLLEANKLNDGEVKKQAIIEMFAENSDLLRVMPIEDIPGGAYVYDLEAALPAVGFRGINEGFTADTGVINSETEVLKIVGGELDVDMHLIKTRGAGIRTTHESLHVKALALRITSTMINGDSEANPREFDGLRVRVGGTQLVEATQSAGTNGPLSLFQLQEAIDKVDGPTHLLMSKRMRNRLNQAATKNVGGTFEWDLDEFGRRIGLYDGLPILIVDVDGNDDKIIDFNEAGPAGGSTASSIYVVAFGEDKVMGIQNGGMDVRDLGELESQPVMRTRVDWSLAMVVQHGRSVARVWGITDAAVVE